MSLSASIRPAFVSLLVFSALCGVAYPVVMIGVAKLLPAPSRTELVGQPFDDPAYFWGRPSAVSYAAMSSGGTNQGATGFVDDKGAIGPNKALVDSVQGRIAALREADPGNTAKVPVDLVTSSGSGLDPHITPAAATYQVSRVARARGVDTSKLAALVDATIEGRTLGVLGEPRVNVVRLNKELDRIAPRK